MQLYNSKEIKASAKSESDLNLAKFVAHMERDPEFIGLQGASPNDISLPEVTMYKLAAFMDSEFEDKVFHAIMYLADGDLKGAKNIVDYIIRKN